MKSPLLIALIAVIVLGAGSGLAAMNKACKNSHHCWSASPQNDLQRSLQARAAQVSTSLAQTRVLLFVESTNIIPKPFAAIFSVLAFCHLCNL